MKSALDEFLEEGFAKGFEEGFEKGFEEGFEKGFEEGFEKGFEEGFEKGRQERLGGLRDLLRGLLMQRFGAIPTEFDARLTRGTPAEIETWGGRLLTARSPTEVMAS